jgi:hypothetical protein
MTRSPLAPALALLFSVGLVSSAYAQPAQAAAPTTPAPAARAKWVAPAKGIVQIQVIKGDTKRVGTDLVTKYQIKNISTGAIALLRIDEYWYDASQTPKLVTTDTQRYKKLINPGEVVEMTTNAPAKPGAARSQVMFSHANGKVDAKGVKKFDK